jgi:thioredoxin-related protein
MRNLLIIAIISLTTLAFTTKTDNVQADANAAINWMSFEEAVAAQKTNPKKIMIDAYTVWCGPCKMLDKNTFSNADVIKYVNENYYAVKFNAQGNEKINFKGKEYSNPSFDPKKSTTRNSSHELANFFRINAYPTILFLDEEATYLTPVKGYKTPQQLELYLKLFATNAYKNLKTNEDWNAYQKEFNYTFK